MKHFLLTLVLFSACAIGDTGPTGEVTAYLCKNNEGHLCAYSMVTFAWANCEPEVIDWGKCEAVLRKP